MEHQQSAPETTPGPEVTVATPPEPPSEVPPSPLPLEPAPTVQLVQPPSSTYDASQGSPPTQPNDHPSGHRASPRRPEPPLASFFNLNPGIEFDSSVLLSPPHFTITTIKSEPTSPSL
ncbi:hypothetical protein HDU67_005239, partial [Dinochytrium kinnereticum]